MYGQVFGMKKVREPNIDDAYVYGVFFSDVFGVFVSIVVSWWILTFYCSLPISLMVTKLEESKNIQLIRILVE